MGTRSGGMCATRAHTRAPPKPAPLGPQAAQELRLTSCGQLARTCTSATALPPLRQQQAAMPRSQRPRRRCRSQQLRLPLLRRSHCCWPGRLPSVRRRASGPHAAALRQPHRYRRRWVAAQRSPAGHTLGVARRHAAARRTRRGAGGRNSHRGTAVATCGELHSLAAPSTPLHASFCAQVAPESRQSKRSASLDLWDAYLRQRRRYDEPCAMERACAPCTDSCGAHASMTPHARLPVGCAPWSACI